MGDGGDGFGVVVLDEGDVDDGGLAAEFDVGDGEEGGAGVGAAEEVEVEGYGVGLVLGGEGAGEVGVGGAEEDGGYEAAVGDCEGGRELADVVREEDIYILGRNTCSYAPLFGEVGRVGMRSQLSDGCGLFEGC